jgi:ABC-type molybdate transport system ATPase subunit
MSGTGRGRSASTPLCGRGPADRAVRPLRSGKTTLVNIIAGLIRPERARVVVDGQVLVDTERGLFVPAHRRGVGYVFQEGRSSRT